MSTFILAWRNLARNGRRTALALAAIALAQGAVLFMGALINGYMDTTLDAMTGPLLGHVQVHAPDWREDRAPDLVIEDLDETLEAIRALDSVESAYARIYSPALAARERDGHAVMVVGLDAARERSHGGLLEGIDEEALPTAGHGLIGSGLAREMGVEIGDELAIVGQSADGFIANDLVVISGILDTPVYLVDHQGLVVNLAFAQQTFAMEGQAHEITIRGQDADIADGLSAEIGALPALADMEVLAWRELAPELTSMMDFSGMYTLILLSIVFVAAAAGITNTMLMATFERRKELGMLLALGASPNRLIAMILIEALLLGVMGVVIGSLVGAVLSLWAGQTGLNMMPSADGQEQVELAFQGVRFENIVYPRLMWRDVTRGLGGVAIVSVLAALWPALHTARLKPVEAMRS